MNLAEVSANDVETAVGPSQWLELAREGLNQANELFGLDLSVDWRYEPDVGSDAEPDGDL